MTDLQFGTEFRGYRKDQVDVYVAKQQDRIEALQKELEEARALLRPAIEQAERIQNAVRIAEEKARETESEAERQAAERLKTLNEACAAVLSEYRDRVQTEAKVFAMLADSVKQFYETLTTQYQKQMDLARDMIARLGLDKPLSEHEFAMAVEEKVRAITAERRIREQKAIQANRRQSFAEAAKEARPAAGTATPADFGREGGIPVAQNENRSNDDRTDKGEN